MINKKLIFDWVLMNKLAIGTPPSTKSDVEFLKNLGIVAVLNLCSEEESPEIEDQTDLIFKRYPLPDHKCKDCITDFQIIQSLQYLEEMIENGPVFVHCFASIERSPLICMAWLMKKMDLNLINSLDYMKQVHPQTNPLLSQIEKLKLL